MPIIVLPLFVSVTLGCHPFFLRLLRGETIRGGWNRNISKSELLFRIVRIAATCYFYEVRKGETQQKS